MNIKTILNPLFGKVMKDGKRIPDIRIMVFGTRIFFEDYLLPDDTIVCTDWADFISMRIRGKYNHVEFLSESEIKKMVSEEKLYNYMERKYDMKKFDLVVSNPPYNKDLHLQILDELTKIANKVVCVHPARWVEDVLGRPLLLHEQIWISMFTNVDTPGVYHGISRHIHVANLQSSAEFITLLRYEWCHHKKNHIQQFPVPIKITSFQLYLI